MRIIDAVEKREFIDKFAYLAHINEIKENDFNLNIPRYVDTFEEEEAVDLDEVSIKLKNTSKQQLEIDSSINNYCKELGIFSLEGEKA